jgi:hypothetical protein
MDALKSRIMEAAPGQVKEAIGSAQFVPRCVGVEAAVSVRRAPQTPACAAHPPRARH